MCAGLHPVHRLSARTQGHVSRRWVPDPPLPLCPRSSGWAHHLADPMHHVSRGVHGPAPLRLALSRDAPGGGAQCPLGDAWGAQFGTLRRHWAYLPHGALSPHLCAGTPESRGCADPRCGLPLPTYILADEKHSRCLTERVYLPTIVRGRVLWHLGYSASKSAAAFTASYGVFQRAALAHEPSYQVRGALTDGFDSTVSSMRILFPGARLGFCLRHALNKLPDKLIGVSASVRQELRSQFHALLHRCRQRKSLRVVALGQRLRHFADRIATTVGEAHGARVRQWFQAKKAGWYTVLADPQMPAMSTVLDQAHNVIDRKLFAMKGFHHPGGSQAAFLTGLAHLYNLIPYQRRAQNAGLCGVQVEGGGVPTSDWMLNLQILTSGGYRYAPDPPNH